MKVMICLLLFAVYMPSCAQPKSIIKKSYAYMSIRFAGTIAVDDDGNQLTKGVDTSYFVYVVAPPKANIKWERARMNNTTFPVIASPVAEKFVRVGLSQADDTPVTIKVPAGNKLWRIDLQEAAGKKKNAAPSATGKTGNVLSLEGTYNNKKFYHNIQQFTELKTIEGA